MWTLITGRFEATRQRVERTIRAVRDRRPRFDHLVRAYWRYHDQRGDRHAAAVTYYGFLSFFPLLGVAFGLLGLVVRFMPNARDSVIRILEETFPGLIGTGPEASGRGEVDLGVIESASARLGLIAFAILLWTGLGWVGALREALRQMWAQEDKGHNIIISKAHDLSTLALLGLVMLLSIALSSLTGGFAAELAKAVGILDSPIGLLILLAVIAAVTLATDMALLIAMFWRLSGAETRPWRLWRGALIGALGFEALRLLATFLLGRLTRNPVYASFAIAVGLVIWMNLITRVILYSAAWTATRHPTTKG